MESNPDPNRMTSAEITALTRRVCEHLGIAFSANRVFPSLADLAENEAEVSDVHELNTIGRNFGIRFREMTGSLNDLLSTVSDSGPILVRSENTEGNNFEDSILVLEVRGRGRLNVHYQGTD